MTNRRTWAVVFLACALLVPALVVGWALLRADRFLVTCADVSTEICTRSSELAEQDFRRRSDARIESLTVEESGIVTICTSSGCEYWRP